MQLKRTWDDYLGLVRALQLPLMCFAYALNLVNCLQCKNMPGAGLKQEKGCTTMSQRGGQRRFSGKRKENESRFLASFSSVLVQFRNRNDLPHGRTIC